MGFIKTETQTAIAHNAAQIAQIERTLGQICESDFVAQIASLA